MTLPRVMPAVYVPAFTGAADSALPSLTAYATDGALPNQPTLSTFAFSSFPSLNFVFGFLNGHAAAAEIVTVIIRTIFAGCGNGITACGVSPVMHMGNHFQFTAVQLGHISVGIGDEVVGLGFVTHIGIPAGGERVIAIVSAHSHAELRTSDNLSVPMVMVLPVGR